MKIDFKGIFEAIKNKHFSSKEVKQMVKAHSEDRLAICRQCPHNSRVTPKLADAVRPDEYCMACGCNLDYKTSCLSCQCPLPVPKWEAVVSLEEEEEIKIKANGQQESSGN